jgi:hypothetical protein
VREWLGGDDDLVQIGGLTGDAFWSGSTVGGRPQDEPAVDGDAADRGSPERPLEGGGRFGIAPWIARWRPRSALSLTAAALAGVCVIAVGLAVLGGISAAPRKASRAASPTRAREAATVTNVRRVHRHVARHHRQSPARHQPAATRTVEATYAPAPSAPVVAPQSPPVDSAPVSSGGDSGGGGSGGTGGGAASSQPAGPVGPGALTGAGSTPSG